MTAQNIENDDKTSKCTYWIVIILVLLRSHLCHYDIFTFEKCNNILDKMKIFVQWHQVISHILKTNYKIQSVCTIYLSLVRRIRINKYKIITPVVSKENSALYV